MFVSANYIKIKNGNLYKNIVWISKRKFLNSERKLYWFKTEKLNFQKEECKRKMFNEENFGNPQRNLIKIKAAVHKESFRIQKRDFICQRKSKKFICHLFICQKIFVTAKYIKRKNGNSHN